MSAKKTLLHLIGTLTGTYVYRRLPRGIDIFYDLRKRLPLFRAETIFDVGANIGQSTKLFLSRFPNAQVYCFEPVHSSFLALRNNLRNDPNVHCFNLALAASEGQAQLVLRGSFEHDESRIQENCERGSSEEIQKVELVSLDSFCDTHAVEQINYVKIDTEGYDLEVLKGGHRMLTGGRVDIVEVEAGMNPHNRHHVPFEELKRYLEQRDYFLFGIYEQIREWPTHEPHLRRANPVFIGRSVIEANTRKGRGR